MSAIEVGQQLVNMVNEGRSLACVDQLYGADVVSIEGPGDGPIEQRMAGLDAVRGKNQWWYDNHEVHSSSAEGPFVGHREDQFAVRFSLDVTPTGGERWQLVEVGLFTVRGDKIVQEEFLYSVGG